MIISKENRFLRKLQKLFYGPPSYCQLFPHQNFVKQESFMRILKICHNKTWFAKVVLSSEKSNF